MGIAERKERDKQEMRDRIIEVATKMFIEDGYDKTSIRNIAEQIEYSPATIYLYFKDKDELFFAIHELGFMKLLQEMEVLKKMKSPFKQLREMGVIYIDFAINNPEYYDLMFIMRAPMNVIKESKGSENCWQMGESTFGMLHQILEACIDQKLIKNKNALLTTLETWSFVHGMVSLYIRDRLQIMNLPENEVRDMLVHALDDMLHNMKA